MISTIWTVDGCFRANCFCDNAFNPAPFPTVMLDISPRAYPLPGRESSGWPVMCPSLVFHPIPSSRHCRATWRFEPDCHVTTARRLLGHPCSSFAILAAPSWRCPMDRSSHEHRWKRLSHAAPFYLSGLTASRAILRIDRLSHNFQIGRGHTPLAEVIERINRGVKMTPWKISRQIPTHITEIAAVSVPEACDSLLHR